MYGDLQYRTLKYRTEGIDNDKANFAIDTSYAFINPKFGANFILDNQNSFYLSYARAQREPVRSDFLAAKGTAVPKSERLDNIELGYRSIKNALSLQTNLYFMSYKDQLVNTGAVNDVGAAIRTNVDDSYRLGLEIDAGYYFNYHWNWSANLSLSRSKIKFFRQVIDQQEFENSDISYSPSLVAGSKLNYKFSENFDLTLLSKFVGKQYLDNTQSEAKALASYWYKDLIVSYTFKPELIQEIAFRLLLNNITNNQYSSNGYTYSYLSETLITENYLYPQAEFNFLLSASLTF